MSRFPFAWRPVVLASSCLCLSLAQAQTQPEALDKVVVTGNPLRGTLSLPADALEGDALVLQRSNNLGDTLSGMPGVSASNFGPNASRPVIRGLDGDRVRILSNAGASVDASNLSFDHAVALDPLVVDRIEVLRGPAALLYGGNALGGVVNLLDNRIPTTLTPGLTGAAELRLGGASRERSGALVLDGGSGRGNTGWGWHADLAGRDAGDQRTPRFDSPTDAGSEARHSVRNSAGRSQAGALGGSLFFGSGRVGLSVDDTHNTYGVTAEPDVSIRMQRQRLATAGEWSGTGLISKISWQASRNRYEHQELEGDGAVGTTFKSRGSDGRVEATHTPVATVLGRLSGVVGLQWEQLDFSALGEEAFVPSTHTRQSGVFALEQLDLGAAQLTAGLRQESVRVRSEGDAPDAQEPKFGPAQSRSFKPRSLALGLTAPLGQGWQFSTNLSRSERAPAYYELYANGVHVATGNVERGDASLGLERARSLDLGLKWEGVASHVHLNVYETRFDRYIALAATGESLDDTGERFPVYAFAGVPARLRGVELEGRWALPTAGWAPGLKLALLGQLDAVRGEQQDTGEPLPRLAPLRALLGLDAQWGAWTSRLELRGTARQSRVPVLDTPTAGSGTWRLALTRQWHQPGFDVLGYLKLDNGGDRLAYNATAVATIRALAPQPGRSVSAGVQLRF
ncbi:TonB-dependent receptor [Roseateles paludis]|uniref:TonB-dependent receptor n=1 Tax=Roseateles paludis TaxID=3145238 RepID=A0ABV0G1J8_9BURK